MSMDSNLRTAIQPLFEQDPKLVEFLEREDLTPDQKKAFRKALDDHGAHLAFVGEHVLDLLDANQKPERTDLGLLPPTLIAGPGKSINP